MAILKLHPPQKLQFPYIPNKQCTTRLWMKNTTDKEVLMQLKSSDPFKYSAELDLSIIPPGETITVNVTMRAPEEPTPPVPCRDTFGIEASFVPDEVDDITPYLNNVEELQFLGVEYVSGIFNLNKRGLAMVVVQPLEFTFHSGVKERSCNMTLTTQTIDQVWFRILKPKIDSKCRYRCQFDPDVGVLGFLSRSSVTAKLHSRDFPPHTSPYVETFLLECFRVPVGAKEEDMRLMFEGEVKVDQIKLKVTYIPMTPIFHELVPEEWKTPEADIPTTAVSSTLVKGKKAAVSSSQDGDEEWERVLRRSRLLCEDALKLAEVLEGHRNREVTRSRSDKARSNRESEECQDRYVQRFHEVSC